MLSTVPCFPCLCQLFQNFGEGRTRFFFFFFFPFFSPSFFALIFKHIARNNSRTLDVTGSSVPFRSRRVLPLNFIYLFILIFFFFSICILSVFAHSCFYKTYSKRPLSNIKSECLFCAVSSRVGSHFEDSRNFFSKLFFCSSLPSVEKHMYYIKNLSSLVIGEQ
jgi:hypothetical protein